MDRDISNWGWGQIMELPDHLFGRRYSVGCEGNMVFTNTVYDISETGLPEKCVIWELQTILSSATGGHGFVSLALGDQLPANDAEFDSLEQLFPDLGVLAGRRRDFSLSNYARFELRMLRLNKDSQGRRLVMRYSRAVTGVSQLNAVITVSSIPRSLPEWFG